MTLKLHVVHIGIHPRHLDKHCQPGPLAPTKGEEDRQNAGASSTPITDQPLSRVREYVSMTKDDEVLWAMFGGVPGAWTNLDRDA
ncbi:hypothetical protein PtB15_6B155 [Puccinia triticina]|nr:hypothetical protein PtB15_6B155 [Puccinia triticina]